MIIIYENIGSIFFTDVWKARNNYINLLLEPSSENRSNYFKKNAVRNFDENEKLIALKLLEMQRYSMLMYTSCGWFFSEISGLETVKILEYASRAMELVRDVTGIELEEEFKDRLAEAKSNIPKYKTGKGIYMKLVKPHRPASFESGEKNRN